jgi:hypothetical protein
MTIAILIHNTVNCKWNGREIGRTVEMDDKRAGMKMRGDEAGMMGEGMETEFLLPSVGEGQDGGDMNRKSSTANARTLRKNFTDAELKLWKRLRNRQTDGEKFRRQQPIGEYIVDFACQERKLVVEVDGGQHGEQIAYDN